MGIIKVERKNEDKRKSYLQDDIFHYSSVRSFHRLGTGAKTTRKEQIDVPKNN